MPDDNPKAARAVADGKAPLQYLEAAANAEAAHVLKHGADKYGRRNWRVTPIDLDTYVGAFRRHVDALNAGEFIDPDSGFTHLAHIIAGAHVVLDAHHYGTLTGVEGPAAEVKHPDSDGSLDYRVTTHA